MIPGTRPPDGKNDRFPTLRVGKRVWLPMWAAANWSSDTVLRKAASRPDRPSDRTARQENIFTVVVTLRHPGCERPVNTVKSLRNASTNFR